MASKAGTTTKARGEETPTSSSNRDRDSKVDRQSIRKATVEDAAGSGSGRDSRSSVTQKDFNRGELRSGGGEGDRKGDDAKEAKRRSDSAS
jgi:hypothetical protein